MAIVPYQRPLVETVVARLGERRRFMQVLAGPRQSGKTTLVLQALDLAGVPHHYASADSPTLGSRAWVTAQWELGRLRAAQAGGSAALVLDEVQKVSGWSEVVKGLWDADTVAGVPLRVVLLGSAPLLMQRGLAESMAGRFELIRVPHWSFGEMRAAFGWGLDRYVYFGGYPGAAALADDEARWTGYVLDALVETTIARDVLLLRRVDKPALLRQMFHLGCDYSAQILSYQKMLGQLQDAGNTTTLAHYLELLGAAGLVTGLQKFSGARVRQRGSSPKLLALNTALVSALSGRGFLETRRDGPSWGRLVESCVGAHLVNRTAGGTAEVTYWRDRGREVDYVLRVADRVAALEVSSGRSRHTRSGLDQFVSAHPGARPFLIGAGGVTLEEFLLAEPAVWLGN